jgi:hypothetical protein
MPLILNLPRGWIFFSFREQIRKILLGMRMRTIISLEGFHAMIDPLSFDYFPYFMHFDGF